MKRNINDAVIAGVCSGIAEQWGWEPRGVRILFVLLWLLGVGIGWVGMPVIYILLWIFMKTE